MDFLRTSIYIVFVSFLACLCACSRHTKVEAPDNSAAILALLVEDSVNVYDSHLDTVIDHGCTKLKIKSIGGYSKVFSDKNPLHIAAARSLGIKPIESESELWDLKRPIVKIESCKEYYLDDLTHSFPYLVPEAAQLLKDIGRTFNDSLKARGGGSYRIKVTSVLRTHSTVKRLRRVNRNASGESAHSFGTTIDISYSKFVCDSICEPKRTFEDLKNLLVEVLYDFHSKGRCYIKYERKQSCFHITVRPTDNS